MIALPEASIIDASVAIKLFLVEDYMAEVQAYFLRAGDDADLYAPDLLPVECGNIPWKQVQRSGYAPEQAQRDLADLLALRELHLIPTVGILPRALELATSLVISAYDACYVALAEQMRLPLLTADNRLAGKLAATPHIVLTLDALFAST